MRPRIPMSPEELPQQRIYVVKELPEKPPSFVCGFATWGDEAPEGIAPPRIPRSARYLGMCEWAWGPANSRIDRYYLSTNRRRSHWLLYVDLGPDDGCPWSSGHHLHAFGPKRGVDARTAAVHLMLESWQHEVRRGELDRFHWVAGTGMLNVADFQAIADRVWPRSADQREDGDDDAE